MSQTNHNVFVYCGSDIVKSRQFYIDKLTELAASGLEIIHIEGKSVDINWLEINLGSESLFGNKRILAIENLLLQQKSISLSGILKRLGQESTSQVYIWENKEIEASKQKEFPANFLLNNFKLPNDLFYFLDQIQPLTIGASLNLSEKIRDAVDENYLFLMLARQIRLLLLVKNDAAKSIPSWQVAKLKKQSQNFTNDQLFNLYRCLRDIDYRQKTSQTVGSYFSDIQFLLSELPSKSC